MTITGVDLHGISVHHSPNWNGFHSQQWQYIFRFHARSRQEHARVLQEDDGFQNDDGAWSTKERSKK